MNPVLWALAPILTLAPALTCVAPRCMAPLFIACGVFALAADWYKRRARPDFDKSLLAVFGALVAFGVLSRIWTVNPEETLQKALQLGVTFGLLVLLAPVVARFDRSDLTRLGLMIAGGLGLGLAVYIAEAKLDFPLYALTHGPDNHDIADVKQNKAAVLLAFWSYLLFPFFVPGQSVARRLAFIAAIPLLFYATFISKSASAQLILIGVPFFAAILYVLPARVSLVLAFCVMTALSAGMPFIARALDTQTSWRTNPALNDSVKSRIEIWDQAARRAFEKPVLGWGLHASPRLPNRDDQSYLSGYKIAHLHPHNGPLQIWFEMGAAGIALLIAFYAVLYRRIARMPQKAQKYAIFGWSTAFLYTLSIWGIWQSWFIATLCFMGLMVYAGTRQLVD